MKALRILAVAALAGALTPALGQEPASSLQGHDTDAPVDVAADRIEVQDRADRAIFTGNVVVRQAALQLEAARITVAYASTGGIQIERIDASGGVFLRSPTETARGQYAIYDIDRRLITLLGGVTLTRGASHVSGGRLVLDLDSGRAVMDGGGPPAPDVPGTATSRTGRVTGTFTVPRRAGSPAQ
ncbi:MAG TPA: LptA/OstA family protein [Allosphingosinicella sp.]